MAAMFAALGDSGISLSQASGDLRRAGSLISRRSTASSCEGVIEASRSSAALRRAWDLPAKPTRSKVSGDGKMIPRRRSSATRASTIGPPLSVALAAAAAIDTAWRRSLRTNARNLNRS